VVVVQNAFVAQFAEVRPDRALAAWPGNPRAELWSGLTAIAAATRAGRPVSPAVLARLTDAARKDPLAAAPFLVRGVQARIDGNEDLAGRAFLAAELRDGRSVPARYFLADHDLRTGDAVHGLAEISILSRMIPNGVQGLAPFVASYAKDRGNWPRLRAVFRSNPELAASTLQVLASDPANSDIILHLAPAPSGTQPMWASRLIQTLVAAGDFEQAQSVWSAIAGVRRPAEALIYDPGFSEPKAPPPFNWTLTSSSLGLAERQTGGRLHILYYGQDDGTLARQLLTLKPGRYRLRMRVAGDSGSPPALNWVLSCANTSAPLLAAALAPQVNASFIVPAGCPGQQLELRATALELPHTFDVTIGGLSLTKDAAGA
jgi:hypothetical protein